MSSFLGCNGVLLWLKLGISACLCCLIVAVSSIPAAAESRFKFQVVGSESGIDFTHTDGSTGEYYIVEAMSSGLAMFDYDADGDIDIYFLNGAPQPAGKENVKKQPRNALYRNDGEWKFTDVTDVAGVGDQGHGLGVTVADYDNDGDPDLYVNNFGPNVLYRNNGDGTFEDVTAAARVANGHRVGAGVNFFDMDADGDLDLYVANYVKFAYDLHVPRTKQGHPIYGSPVDYESDPDTLFRNNGDGTFTDVSLASGIAKHAGPSMATICADVDQDGDADVLVTNDGSANFLFENDGSGHFKEAGLVRGFAFDASGNAHASMGIDVADFNQDGFPDFHVTSFQGELATLFRNVDGLMVEDVTSVTGAGIGTLAPVTWGQGFADFDNDGDRDLMIACGHLYDKLHHFDQTSNYRAPNILLENKGRQRFVNVTQDAGPGMGIAASSRGAAFGDLDNDGDIDAVIVNSRQQPTLLRNDSESENNWIAVRLQGKIANRDGVGARITVKSGDLKQSESVHSGRGYQGHFGSRVHFGLGRRNSIDEILVRWPGGGEDSVAAPRTNQVLTIRESGNGRK